MTEHGFELTVLTPLIVGGAVPRATDVLREGMRPPMVRGQMRWWFRALAAGALAADVDTVRTLEARVFGSPNCASPVGIRARPFSNLTGGRSTAGTAYLSMGDDHGDYRRNTRNAIVPGAQTTMALRFVREGPDARAALWALWLAVMLGGFGARGRRGFGSVRLAPASTAPGRAPSFAYPSEIRDVPSCVVRGLQDARAAFAGLTNGRTPVLPPPAAFHRGSLLEVLAPDPAHCRIWIVESAHAPWQQWSDAMAGLREVYRGLKQAVGAPPEGPRIGGEKRPQIGSAQPRDPSPLMIQIKQAGRAYFGVVIVLDDTDQDGVTHRYFKRGPQDTVGVDAVAAVLERDGRIRPHEVQWS